MYPISACFGFPFMDLPSVTLNGLNTILNAGTVRKPSSLSKNKNQYFNPNLFQFSFLSNVGDGSTSIFDLCGWGAISFMLLKIFPEILIAQVKTARLVVIPRNS